MNSVQKNAPKGKAKTANSDRTRSTNKRPQLQAEDIKNYFKGRGREFVTHLLGQPHYTEKGGEELVYSCPLPGHDDNDPSFSYNTTENVWNCFGCSRNGDLISLWEEIQNTDFQTALRQIADTFPGVQPNPPKRKKKKKPPKIGQSYTLTDLEEEKGLPPDHLKKYGVKETKRDKYTAVYFPRKDESGKEIGHQLRGRDKNGEKIQLNAPDRPVALIGLEQLASYDRAQPLLFVEGDTDHYTGLLHGLQTIGTPGTTFKKEWAEEYGDKFAEFEKVILVQEPGDGAEGLAQTMARRLQPHGVELLAVKMPEDSKDLNELHLEHYSDITENGDDFKRKWSELLETAAPVEIVEKTRQPATDGPEGEKKKKPTQSQILVEIGQYIAEKLFYGPDSTPYITFKTGDHLETHPLKTGPVREMLAFHFFQKMGKAPGGQGMQDALNTLAGIARFEGREHKVFTRLAEHDGNIYLNLCTPNWDVVEITPNGWECIPAEACPVKFIQPSGMLPLPRPTTGGGIEDLFDLINLRDERDRIKYAMWIATAFRPGYGYPIAVFVGEQGTGKSFVCRVTRRIIDPSEAPIRTTPRDERDLFVAAKNSHVLAYDNLSHLANWLSDGLCRIATGGGLSTRRLYTDTEEVYLDVKRPILLNSILQIASRQDLLDRAMIIELDRIPPEERRSERELLEEFDKQHPAILGAFLDVVATGLRNLPQVNPNTLREAGQMSRMADFAEWITACEEALDLEPLTAVKMYNEGQAEAVREALEDNIVFRGLAAMVEEYRQEDGNGWRSIPSNKAPWLPPTNNSPAIRGFRSTNLWKTVGEFLDEDEKKQDDWPKNEKQFGKQLRRLAPRIKNAADFDLKKTRSRKGSIWTIELNC